MHEGVKEISRQLRDIADANGVSGNAGSGTNNGLAGGISAIASASGSTPESLSDESVDEEQDIQFEGENFSDENIKMVVYVIERIVNRVGVDELNDSVNRHYEVLINNMGVHSDSRTNKKGTASKEKKGTVSEPRIDSNIYGRYTVTSESIQKMAPLCGRANTILDKLDKFYKEKFKSLGEKYAKASSAIHAISTLLSKWGSGECNAAEEFSKDDSDKAISEKLQLSSVTGDSHSDVGKIVNGGAFLLKIVDFVMPLLKKSNMLVKLNEKMWNLVRQDINNPYFPKMMDVYMMEHYELEYGMSKGQSGYFPYYHNAVKELDSAQRRALENSVFAAEEMLVTSYTVNENDPQKNRAIWCGIFLNLTRSGMCNRQDIPSDTANDIVDKLYNSYISEEGVTPRVDISPDKLVIGVTQ